MPSSMAPALRACTTRSAWTRRCSLPRPSDWCEPSRLAAAAACRRSTQRTQRQRRLAWSGWPSSPSTRRMPPPTGRWGTSWPERLPRASCCCSRQHGLTEQQNSHGSIAGLTPSCSTWGRQALQLAVRSCSTSRWCISWLSRRTSCRPCARPPRSSRTASRPSSSATLPRPWMNSRPRFGQRASTLWACTGARRRRRAARPSASSASAMVRPSSWRPR
mmetsp:Transcript_117424/g.343866  ORF Transcript_117424/g.343866 Transcript_117424/m.343866 type:complete len:218 (-) Transcript_117424:354-1007(-)